MVNITNKSDYALDSVHKTLIIEFEDGTEIENSNIKSESMHLNEILMEDAQLRFGRCNASQFSVTLASIAANIKNEVIRPYVQIGDNKLPLGVFTVNYVERSADRPFKQIAALDNMDLVNQDVSEWYNNVEFPVTLKEFRDGFFEFIGLEQVETSLPFDDLEVNNPFGTNIQINGKTIIEGICELNARFGHCDRYGKFKYVQLDTSGLYPSETLYPSEELFPRDGGDDLITVEGTYISATYADYNTMEIDKVIIVDEYGAFKNINADGNNAYVLNNNYLLYGKTNDELEDIGKRFLNLINAISYRPTVVSLKGLPYVELGDRFKVAGRTDTIESYVFNRTLTGIQALRDTFTSEGEEYLYNDLNSIQNTMDRLNKATQKLKIEVTATEEGLKSKVSKGDVSTEISQESDQITLKGNRLVVESDNFDLTKEGNVALTGEVSATKFDINGSTISIESQTFMIDEVEIDIDNWETSVISSASMGKGFTFQSELIAYFNKLYAVSNLYVGKSLTVPKINAKESITTLLLSVAEGNFLNLKAPNVPLLKSGIIPVGQGYKYVSVTDALNYLNTISSEYRLIEVYGNGEETVFNDTITNHFTANSSKKPLAIRGIGKVKIKSSVDYPNSSIYVNGDGYFENLIFDNTGGDSYALHYEVNDSGVQGEMVFKNCTFIQNSSSRASAGVGLGNGCHVKFIDCEFINPSGVGLYFHNNSQSNVTNQVIEIHNCRFDCGTYSISIDDSARIYGGSGSRLNIIATNNSEKNNRGILYREVSGVEYATKYIVSGHDIALNSMNNGNQIIALNDYNNIVNAYVSKPEKTVYGQSYYVYSVPVQNANKYDWSVSSVTVQGLGALTGVVVDSVNKDFISLKDTSSTGTGYMLSVSLVGYPK